MKQKFTFCYSREGVFTLLPTFISVESNTPEEAIQMAIDNLKKEHEMNCTIYTEKGVFYTKP